MLQFVCGVEMEVKMYLYHKLYSLDFLVTYVSSNYSEKLSPVSVSYYVLHACSYICNSSVCLRLSLRMFVQLSGLLISSLVSLVPLVDCSLSVNSEKLQMTEVCNNYKLYSVVCTSLVKSIPCFV